MGGWVSYIIVFFKIMELILALTLTHTWSGVRIKTPPNTLIGFYDTIMLAKM